MYLILHNCFRVKPGNAPPVVSFLCFYSARNYCIENNLMDLKISEVELDKVPFKLLLIPVKYPSPDRLRLI